MNVKFLTQVMTHIKSQNDNINQMAKELNVNDVELWYCYCYQLDNCRE